MDTEILAPATDLHPSARSFLEDPRFSFDCEPVTTLGREEAPYRC